MPENCKTCDHRDNTDEGWHCHIWIDEPDECRSYHEEYPGVNNITQKLAIAESALKKIAKWHGEFPPSGQKYPTGEEMSFGAAYGSNGERDHMRQVAQFAYQNINA
jgi:hypothetical protein